MTFKVLLSSGCSVDADLQTPPGPGTQWRSLRSPHAEPGQQHVRRLVLKLQSFIPPPVEPSRLDAVQKHGRRGGRRL